MVPAFHLITAVQKNKVGKISSPCQTTRKCRLGYLMKNIYNSRYKENINRMHKIIVIKKQLSNFLCWVFVVPCFSCFAAQALAWTSFKNAWALGFCVGSPKLHHKKTCSQVLRSGYPVYSVPWGHEPSASGKLTVSNTQESLKHNWLT